METWKPIETAPRDGTRFLAVCAGPYIRLVHFADKCDRLPIGDTLGDLWPDVPTHWMPLPKDPYFVRCKKCEEQPHNCFCTAEREQDSRPITDAEIFHINTSYGGHR